MTSSTLNVAVHPVDLKSRRSLTAFVKLQSAPVRGLLAAAFGVGVDICYSLHREYPPKSSDVQNGAFGK